MRKQFVSLIPMTILSNKQILMQKETGKTERNLWVHTLSSFHGWLETIFQGFSNSIISMQESATHVQCVFKCWFQWAMPLTKHQPMITSSTLANTTVTLVALAQIIFFYKCEKNSKNIFSPWNLVCQGRWRIIWNIREHSVLEIESSKLIN